MNNKSSQRCLGSNNALRIINGLSNQPSFLQSKGKSKGGSMWVPPRINRQTGQIELHLVGSNFTGPRTDIKRRWIDEKQTGTTQVDEGARHHDIQYYNTGLAKAKGKINDNQMKKAIITSDNRLANIASNPTPLKIRDAIHPLTVANKLLNMAQSQIVKPIIKGKAILTSHGIASPALFTKVDNPDDKKFMNEDKPEFEDNLPPNYLNSGGKKINRVRRLQERFNMLSMT